MKRGVKPETQKVTVELITRQRREADHSPPSSTDVKNGGAIPILRHTSSWRGA
jgi:hypothetical protein